MDEWRWYLFGGLAGLALSILHKIFLEVRSIRQMMLDARQNQPKPTRFDPD